jgi:hypothetical protein
MMELSLWVLSVKSVPKQMFFQPKDAIQEVRVRTGQFP